MSIIWTLKMVAAFVIEVIAVIGFGYVGYQIPSTQVLKIIGSILGVLVFAIIWGTFFLPRASYPWAEPWLYFGKFLMLIMPSYVFYTRGQVNLAIIWFVILLIHFILLYFQPENPFA